MYMDFKVKIPSSDTGISRKRIKGVTYIYYAYGRNYNADKKYTVPKCTSIGKSSDEDPDMMYPNVNYLRFFPEEELPDADAADTSRSGCLRMGAFLIIRKIIAEYHLDEIMERLIGKDSGLFLDLAAYTIVAENNAGQYYPDYAYSHPLFTKNMTVYSDSKISDFINSIGRDQSIAFQNEWNARRDHREKIYISYDSTDKNCQAGDLDFVEFSHAKDDSSKPILNYSIAYDRDNAEPLFYEEYPGSIVDVSQLQLMLEKAKGYGYSHIGFILDRGYFSQGNIHYMDECGYEFIIMVKGMKPFVSSLIQEVKGSFEDKREYSIRDYRVNGITLKRRLYASDAKDRYFHIFYNERRKSSERESVESKVDRMMTFLQEHEGKQLDLDSRYKKYFDLIFYHEGKVDEKFMYAKERCDVVNREIDLCGYFVIITSEKMTAEEAIDLYKSRDASEKLFRGDKSYLGNHCFRVQSNESLHAKIFIEFIALIIRNRIHTLLKQHMSGGRHRQNYLTVPAAIRELEKIELIRQPDRNYRLDHAVTATQKDILKAFGLTDASIRTQASGINDELASINRKGK